MLHQVKELPNDLGRSLSQGRIHVWSESAPPPPWQINHANSAYFRLFLGYFRVISATRPPFGSRPPFYISWIHPWLSYNNFTDKNQNGCVLTNLTKKQCFFAFLYWTGSSTTVIQSPEFINDCKFCISVNKYQ